MKPTGRQNLTKQSCQLCLLLVYNGRFLEIQAVNSLHLKTENEPHGPILTACSVYTNPFLCSQGHHFFLKLFVPARFFDAAYEEGTPYVLKQSAGTDKDSLLLLNRIRNLNSSVPSIYPQSPLFPGLCSTNTSIYVSPQHPIHTVHWLGTGRLWQMLNSLVSLSISSHPSLYHILSLLLASSTVYNSIKDCKASKMKRWGNHSLRGQSHRQLRAGGKVRACHECAKMLSPQHCRGWSPMEVCRAHVILAQGTAEISVSLKGNMQPLKIQCYFFIFYFLQAQATWAMSQWTSHHCLVTEL